MSVSAVGELELQLLYCEISSLIARCVFDYWTPFSLYIDPSNPGPVRLLEDVIKYRPPDPTVYPNMVEVLTELELSAQVAVLQFYEAVERWRREIDTLAIVGRNTFDGVYMNRLQRRLGEVFPFAVIVMQELRPLVDRSVEVDRLVFSRLFELAVDARRKCEFDDPIREVVRFLQMAEGAKHRHFGDGRFSVEVAKS